MKTLIQTSVLAAALGLGTLAVPAAADTLGDAVNQGRLSTGAVKQLASGTGLSIEDAMNATLEDIVAIRWQDD